MQFLIEARIGELNAELLALVTNPQRGPVSGQVYQIQGQISGLEWVLSQQIQEVKRAA